VQAFLGTGTVFLTYLLGRRLLGHFPGLIAALLAALSYSLVHQSIHFLSEVLFTPLVLLAALALYDALEKPGLTRFALAGVLIGISDLVRPTLLFLPVFLLWPLVARMGWRAAVRQGSVLAAGVLL